MRKTRRHRGGDFFSSNTYPNNTYPNNTYSNTYPTNNNSGLNSVLDSVKNAYISATEYATKTYDSISNPTPSYTYEDPNKKPWWKFWGGKSRKRRGGAQVGYPDLSLATNVNDIKVVEPTYWIKGGKRKRSSRKNKSSRRYRKK